MASLPFPEPGTPCRAVRDSWDRAAGSIRRRHVLALIRDHTCLESFSKDGGPRIP